MISRSKGIFFLILSALSFALMTFFVRLSGDLPIAEKALFRNGVAMLVALPLLPKGLHGFHLTRKGAGFLTLRVICGTIGILCNFYAVSTIPLADAGMLNKLSPFFNVLVSALLLKEHIKPKKLVIIALIFAGSLLVIKPSPSNLLLGPSLIAALGGVMAGSAYAGVRGSVLNGVPKALVIFAFSAFSTLVVVPSTVTHYVAPTGVQWVCLLLTGAFAASGQLCITAAYSYAPANEICVYDFTQILFAALLGFFFLGQVPDILSLLGYAVIIGLALYDFLSEKKMRTNSKCTNIDS